MTIECLVLGMYIISIIFFSFISLSKICLAWSGAGQEVGKSCAVVTINGKRIMFDCGMHMGHLDHKRFPDFSLIPKSSNFNTAIDCIIITHL